MLRSFSEFKFFQSFRVPVEEADEVRFLVEVENNDGHDNYIDDAKLIDISLQGVGLTTTKRLSVGQELNFSLHFRRYHIDVMGKVVRVFTGGLKEDTLLYGAEFEETDKEEIKRFLEQYVSSFSYERLRDCMIQMALTERYSSAAEGLEMFSLLISLYKDMTNFSDKSDFVENMLEEIMRIMNAGRTTLYLVNPETNELEAYAAAGIDKKLPSFDYRKGIAGSVFTSGVSLNIDAINDSSRFSTEMDDIYGFKIRSLICNPLHNREDKVIGVVEVINKRNDERFSVEDEKIMKVVALVFSAVFHNYNPVASESIIRKFSAPNDRQNIMIGRSKHMNGLRNSIIKLKDIDSPVYICGENGSGKSLLAKILHFEGKRGLKPYFEIECGGQLENYLEELIFGKNGQGPGKIESCIGGSIVFRDIHLLPFTLQRRLADGFNHGRWPAYMFAKNNASTNASNSGSAVNAANGNSTAATATTANSAPIGSGRSSRSQKEVLDLRVIVTSSKNLEKLVSDGRFNRSLYEYVSKSLVYIPPLRKREDDIKELINHFLKVECRKQGFLLKTLAPSVISILLEYEWPGNVGELKNCIERMVTYNPKNHVITNVGNLAIPLFNTDNGGDRILDEIPYAGDSSIVLKDRLALIERQIIINEIKRNNGNKSRAAREMGISREALRKKMMLSQDILDAIEGYKSQLLRDQEKEKEKEKEKEIDKVGENMEGEAVIAAEGDEVKTDKEGNDEGGDKDKRAA